MQQLRTRMFIATFWSLKRYGFEVVVSVHSKKQLDTLLALHLPVFRTLTLYNLTRKSEQPKLTLLHAVTAMRSDKDWQHFEFVYYTDGDQILHMRHLNIIYDTLLLDASFVLCPHRLHTMMLPKDMPKQFRHSKHFTIADMMQHTKPSSIILEKGLTTRGSCCDDGRYFILNTSKCHNFWYYCDELHAFTLLEWVKFGPHGFPAPLTTEHMGKCRHYAVRRQCDVPKDCSASLVVASDGSTICDEISKSHNF